MEYSNHFPKRLKLLREAHKVSMSELSEYLFLSSSAAINQFERGRSKPSIDTAMQISLFFGISLEWLVGLSDTPYTTASIYVANEARIQRIQKLKDSLKNNVEQKITFFTDKNFIEMVESPILPPSVSLNFQGTVIFLANATFLNDAEHLVEVTPTTAITQPTNSHEVYKKRIGRLMHNKAERYKALFACYNTDYAGPLFIINN